MKITVSELKNLLTGNGNEGTGVIDPRQLTVQELIDSLNEWAILEGPDAMATTSLMFDMTIR